MAHMLQDGSLIVNSFEPSSRGVMKGGSRGVPSDPNKMRLA